MNPYSEERLTEEVLYLHSLWRRGPPRGPKPTRYYLSTAVAAATNKRPRDTKNRKQKKKKPRLEPLQDTGPEWPCPEPVQNQPSTSSGWPPMPCATPAARLVSSEERANRVALQLQYKGIEACRRFLIRNADSGSDEEVEEEEGNDGEIMESEEYKFFLNLFMENDELRGYYEKNSEDGLFCCLVCDGMGKKKSGKRFKNCIGLVHHSNSISRTKKKVAHRAFGQAVCRVFGWDIDRLPTIVLNGEPLSRSLANSGDFKPEENQVAEEHDSWVHNENVAILNDEIDMKNEQKWEEEKTAEDLISGEVPESIMEACEEFFAASLTSMADDDVSENNAIEEREEFKFFLKLFIENESLRRYYKNKYDDGEFSCLVCEGAGKKTLRSFKTCVRLLRHTTYPGKNKTGKKRVKPHIAKMLKVKMLAHRAYSLVICQVLGWDIEKLPAIVLKGEGHGCSLKKLDVLKDDPVGNAGDNTNEVDDPVRDDSTEID
ncbi:uncharacterized protein LOC111796743 isoform X2 [Cucurbita pepo subsp. pepo]|uniref:uncharacterized protein LOC111796743 isoform X2 n=1 Tax=Cucurbita pepo subsp. pepo TaxID=3664 RepID=UPI000C9D7515|nr:uncharacterized protein LOC111796743 isoform X2 [Cucurbita pepo subsp. pepo]